MSRYATPTDLTTLAINAAALTGISSDDQQAALDAASQIADGYFASKFILPLVAPYPADLVQRVCEVGAWLALKKRGFNPEGDPGVREGYEDAIRWLENVAKGLVSPAVKDSTPGGVPGPVPWVSSRPPRGW